MAYCFAGGNAVGLDEVRLWKVEATLFNFTSSSRDNHVLLGKAWLSGSGTAVIRQVKYAPSFFSHTTICNIKATIRLIKRTLEIMKFAVFSILAFIAVVWAVVPPQKAVIVVSIFQFLRSPIRFFQINLGSA